MNRELVINVTQSEISIALCEDKVLVELSKEQCQTGFAVGDIYLGRVRKIMPGLNAAFVNIGHEKDAFIHYLDLGSQFSSLQRVVDSHQPGKRGKSRSWGSKRKWIPPSTAARRSSAFPSPSSRHTAHRTQRRSRTRSDRRSPSWIRRRSTILRSARSASVSKRRQRRRMPRALQQNKAS